MSLEPNRQFSARRRAMFTAIGLTTILPAAFVARDSKGSTPKDSNQSVCAKHRMPGAECPWCHPNLVEEMGECRGHGVPEAYCWKCNPILIEAFKHQGDWCSEHSAPESLCPTCRRGGSWMPPQASERAAEPMRNAEGIEILAPDEVVRSRRTPSVTCSTEKLRIQLTSPEIARTIGLETVQVERRPVTETLTCNAEIRYDARRYLRLVPRAPGVVRTVLRDVGERVQAGEVLLEVDSVALAPAKSEYLQTQASLALWKRNFEREQQLVERGVSTGKEVLEAETKLAETRIAIARAAQSLRNLGLSDEEIERAASTSDTAPTLTVKAPFDGLVVERSVVAGDIADGTRPLVAVADTSSMWAMLDVQAQDLSRVRLGQDVVLSVEGVPGYSAGGTIQWISSEVDPRTRTVPARVEVPNADGILRAHMFGRAVVRLHRGEPVVVVPKKAVQWEGCCNVVFVRQSDEVYLPRKVQLGCDAGEFYEVVHGLEPGERVVTQGSYLLKTEILKGSIGAGCCEVEHLDK